MGQTKIIVTKMPERKQDCPFYTRYPEYNCSIGGICSYYDSGLPDCEKLISFDDYLHRDDEKENEVTIDNN